MLKFLPLLIFVYPFVKWALAVQYPDILKRFEGRRAARALEAEWGKGRKDEKVSEIARTLLKANRLRAVFRVLEGDPINAVALPHGRIFVWRGLLDLAEDDPDMLAGVLAHELGHLSKEHYLRSTRRLILAQFALGMFGGGWFGTSVKQIAWRIMTSGFSKAQEEEADEAAVKILVKAGYDPGGLARLFDVLAAKDRKGSFLGTHPAPKARAQRVRNRIAKTGIA